VKLFNCFDTDSNQLIDSLELLITLSLASGMDMIDKLMFCYSLYDFDHSGELSRDEVSLLLRTAVYGMKKICKITVPSPEELETTTALIFLDADRSNDSKLSIYEFQTYCCLHPVVSSWMKYYSSLVVSIHRPLEGFDEPDVLNMTFSRNTPATNFSSQSLVTPSSPTLAQPEELFLKHRLWFNLADSMLPEEPPAARPDPPEDAMEPQWIHGNRCYDVRSNVKYASTGNILFFVSAIGVNMSKDSETGLWNQKLLFDHDAPLTCLDVDPTKRFFATADRVDGVLGGNQKEAKIIIWDALTNSRKLSVSVTGCLGIRYLDFSADAKYLICLSTDQHNFLMMYEVETLRLVYSAFLGASKVMDIKFTLSNSVFAVAGADGMDFYTEEGGSFMSSSGMKIYEKRLGLFQSVGKAAEGIVISCLSEFEGTDEMISGNVKGHLLFWRGRNCVQLLKAHQLAVTSLHYNQNCKTLVSGSRDGKINLYKLVTNPNKGKGANARRNSFTKKSAFQRAIEVVISLDLLGADSVSREVRSVCLWDDAKKVLVSTLSGEILELATEGMSSSLSALEDPDAADKTVPRIGDDINGGPLLRCHWDPVKQPAVHGLAKLASGGFMSCGSDGIIRQWQTGDDVQHKEIKRVALDSGCQSLTTSSTSLAVGLDGSMQERCKGQIKILALEDFRTIADLTDPTDHVTTLSFSADGNALAAGSKDKFIYLYHLNTESAAWELRGKLSGHTAPLRQMDFSSDGQFLRSSDGADGLIVWDLIINLGARVTEAETLRTITWLTNSVPYCWELKGAFASVDQTVETVECLDRMNHLAVMGLSSGALLLTRIPAGISATHRREEAHCGRVSAICFIDDGARLVTAGSEDGLIQVWKVTYDFDELEVADASEDPPEDEDEDEEKEVIYDSGEDEDKMEITERPEESSLLLNKLKKLQAFKEASGLVSRTPAPDAGTGEGGESLPEPNRLKLSSAAQIEALGTTPFFFDKSKSVVENWLNANPWAEGLLSAPALTALPEVSPPRAEIQLDWIYGFSGRSTRGAVKYSKEGDIIYPVSTVAVIFNKVKALQTHAMNHSDEITCLDVHLPSGYAATSQRSYEGNVSACVWATDSGHCVRVLNCGPVNAASAIAFSPAGDFVAVACLDISHSVLVFDWTNNVLKCRVPGGGNKILALVFSQVSDPAVGSIRLLQAGVDHFHLLRIKGRQMSAKRGKFGGARPATVNCAVALPLTTGEGAEFLMGMSDGSLATITKGEKVIASSVPVHAKAVTALFVLKLTEGSADDPPTYKIITGGVDGLIKVLSQDLETLSEYNVYKGTYGLYPMGKVGGIKSLCVDKGARKILFGTAGGEISEIDLTDGSDVNGGPLVAGHCRDEFHGLITHPMKAEAATVGDDKTLRIWNLEKRKMAALLELPDIARAVCYSPTGQIIAVGLGGEVSGANRVPRRYDGKVVIVSYMQGTLRIVHEITDSKQPITSIAFSADGSELFIGSEDSCVYSYNIHEDFKKTFTFSDHRSAIAGIDLSVDGKVMCTSDLLGQVLYWNLESELTRGERLTDQQIKKMIPSVKWFVRQNVLGFDSVGVQKVPFAMGSLLCLAQSRDKSLFATGDTKGELSIFSCPCEKPAAPFSSMLGHSPGGVSKVSFSAKDRFILTSGKYDRSIFQWKLEKSSVGEEPMMTFRPTTQMTRFDSVAARSAERDVVPAIVTDESLLIGGVDFAKQSVTSLPEVEVDSLSSLGMSCSSFTRQVTHLPVALYCGSGDIITVVGALPVAINAHRHGQTHWQVPKNEWGFLEDIGVVTITGDARTVVVCEKAPASMSSAAVAEKFNGRLFAFNSSTGIKLAQFPGTIKGGVVAAAFSADNRTLGCLVCDSHHSLTIFNSVTGDWRDPTRLFTGQVDVNPVTLIASILQSPTNAEFQYVTGGRGRLRFWKLRGRNVVSSACETSTNEAITALLSIDPGQVIIGDKSGGLSLWDGKLCLQTIPECHARRVSALCKYDTRQTGGGSYGFISASSDLVRVWSNTLQPLQELVIDEMLHRVNRVTDSVYVTSMCTDSIFKRLLLTLSSSLILEVSVDSKAVLLVTEGHMSGSFVALAAHPKETRILITGGYDGWLKCWDIRSPAALEVMQVGEPITSVLILEDGQTLVVALTDTLLILEFSVHSATKFKILHKLAKVTKSVITVVRSPPDQSVLVVGSADGSLVVLDPDNKYAVAHTLRGHNKAIEGMDFSLPSGKYLRSFSRASDNESTIQTVFHVMEKGSRATYEVVTDTNDLLELSRQDWVTVSSPAAPEGRGTLETVNQMKASEQGVVVKHAAISRDRKLLAVGYSDGLVRLFR
jgi:WD40 repeat protein